MTMKKSGVRIDRNGAYYRDPTAQVALSRVVREERRKEQERKEEVKKNDSVSKQRAKHNVRGI